MAATISTIGFTGTSAQRFFDRLRHANVSRVIDVRLHNTSQLSGFAKAQDLPFFLNALAGIDYIHMPLLAPTDEMLKEYKKLKGAWSAYERAFMDLMRERKIEERINPELLNGACLLCSEDKPHHCHRRLVCEYISDHYPGQIEVRHL